jgi:hypothetical protein
MANASDVTDLELLPRRFDFFVAEMRGWMEDILVPGIKRIESKLDDLSDRVRHVEQEQGRIQQRLSSHEERLSVLEAAMAGRKAQR